MRITLNGTLGSGKSTIGKLLAARLGIPYISTGQMFREIGHISNLDALQVNLEAESNTAIDEAVDKKVQALNSSNEDFVLDSRMAWHFVKNAVHIFLSVSPEDAAERVMSDRARFNEQYASKTDAMKSLLERRESENRRYSKLYRVDIENISNYDLHVITDDASVEDIVELALHFIHQRTNHKTWIAKQRLVPMITIRDASGITFATRTTLSDKFSLPVCIDDNFGFFFHGAPELIRAFYYELNLIPYRNELPEFLNSRKYDVVQTAREALKPSDLYDWEEIFGVKLSFTRELIKKQYQ